MRVKRSSQLHISVKGLTLISDFIASPIPFGNRTWPFPLKGEGMAYGSWSNGMMNTISVNGQERAFPRDGALLALLGELGIQPDDRGVAVAVNGDVVPRRDWASTLLAPGAQIEVLRAAQGG